MPHTPIDLLALREPSLLVPHRKPAVPVKIDYSNPISSGLIDCYILNERAGAARSLVQSPTWGELSASGTVLASWVSTDMGAGIFCATNKSCFLSTTQTFINVPYSIACNHKTIGTPNQFRYLWYANAFDKFSLYFDGDLDNTFYMNQWVFNLGDGGTYADFSDGGWHNLVATARSTSRRDLYINQDHHSWGINVATAADTNDYLAINGRDDTNNRYADGEMTYFYIWDRELSDEEAKAINADPYQIFKPI